MFVEHSAINSDISENSKLWRYMDFAKLVSLISNQSLYFCRCDKFKDVFEGKINGLEVEHTRKGLERIASTEYIIEGQILKFEGDTRQALIDKAEEFTLQTYRSSENARKTTFINCWHINEFESAAMWDLYLKSDEGIAIQTTFNKLKNSLQVCHKDIFIGKVDYIDYTTQRNFFGNGLEPFFTKRISFSHENEVRLLYSGHLDSEFVENENISGINIKIDLSELIECIYVSPEAPEWFVDVVKSIMINFNVDTKVIHSNLYNMK